MNSSEFLTYSDTKTPQEVTEYQPCCYYTQDDWFEDALDNIYAEFWNSMSYKIWVRRYTPNREAFCNLLRDLAYSELMMRLDRESLAADYSEYDDITKY